MDVPVSCELWSELPDRYRYELKSGRPPDEIRQGYVVDRDKSWGFGGGATVDRKGKILAGDLEEGYVLYLTTLVPLRREKGMVLTSLPEGKFQGKAVQGVKATLKDHDDVELHFDKETGMLVRVKRDTVYGGLTAEREYLFGDYKEFDGGKWPTKYQELINGVKTVEFKFDSYRFPEKADQTQFVKP
jgi:hypothetical protein